MKRILPILLCLLLLLPLTVSADLPKVVDESGLLSSDELQKLEEAAATIVAEYSMDVLILTVDSLNGMDEFDFADDYYDSHGYGIGSQQSGIIFLLSMSERVWAVRTIGEAKKAVTDYEIDGIIDVVWNDLSSGNYYETFDLFLSCVEDEYYDFRNNDSIYDGSGNDDPYVPQPDNDIYYPNDAEESLGISDILSRLGISLLIGAVAALIVLLIMRSQMNTAKQQSGAKNYMTGGSYDLYRCQDIFLYSRTSRIRKPDPNTSGGSRSGGGISRSSGGSRGGRSGRF